MGGTVKIAFRLHDGIVTSDTRWTNNMPAYLNAPEMIRDDPDYLRAYALMDSEYRSDDHTIAPTGYGLVVVDAITHTIYECNGYSRPGETSPAHINLRRGTDAAQIWIDFMEMGRLFVVNLVDDGKPPIPMADIPGETIFDKCTYMSRRENEMYHYMIQIDLSPWKVISFPESEDGYRAMWRALKESSFPMTEADDKAWEEEIEERFGEDEA